MIITKKRIRNLSVLDRLVGRDEKFAVGVSDIQRFESKLSRIGFSEKLANGDTMLPSSVGPVSCYNAEGRLKVRKDLPMETAHREALWHWSEYNGPYDRIERSRIVDVPYPRYPREFVTPPSIEFKVTFSSNGDKILTSPVFELNEKNSPEILHTINLFLEIFGECQFFTGNLVKIETTPIQRLNWKILPQGQIPWNQLKEEIKPFVDKAPKGNHPVINYRLETINKFCPDFVAVGRGGFTGYIVLGFVKKKIFTLESLYYGNATYIFGIDWEELSKKTKAEILNEKLQEDRIIHHVGWARKINDLFSK